MATLFRKKPVVVEARQLTTDNIDDVAEWCNGKRCGVMIAPELQFVLIETLEGEMRADLGDYVIRGVKGEFYPCKPDIFQATYEPVVSVL